MQSTVLSAVVFQSAPEFREALQSAMQGEAAS
jgi:hypothetical protein